MADDTRVDDLLSLQIELEEKNHRLATVQEQLQQLKNECETIKQENRKLKAQRASMVATSGSSLCAGEDDDDDEPDLEAKLSFFLHKVFGLKQPRTVFAREDLQVLALNALMSLHHLDHAPELKNSDLTLTPTAEEAAQPDTLFFWKGARIAFNYGLLFAKQLSEECMEEEYRLAVNRNFPLQWLLGIFPATFPTTPTDFTNLSWLPLHLFLAANPLSESAADVDQYIDHLGLLLDVFGAAAVSEDVKPLSIAVSKRLPSLPAIQFYVEQVPDSLCEEDEDGSIPFMHACGNNENSEAVEWLLQKHSEGDPVKGRENALFHTDQFGCAAIHYATFNGRTELVEFLLQASPKLAELAESNGALPLHDAVQNQHGPNEQWRMVQLLLQAHSSAVRCRDAQGAFPLHLAAKCSNLTVFENLYNAFPNAIFAADTEGLLPLHYYAERTQRQKQEHAQIQSFILQKNPTSTVYTEEQLWKAPKSTDNASGGGVSSFVSSWFRSSSSAPAASTAQKKELKSSSNANVNNNHSGSNNNGKKMRRSSAVKMSAHGR